MLIVQGWQGINLSAPVPIVSLVTSVNCTFSNFLISPNIYYFIRVLCKDHPVKLINHQSPLDDPVLRYKIEINVFDDYFIGSSLNIIDCNKTDVSYFRCCWFHPEFSEHHRLHCHHELLHRLGEINWHILDAYKHLDKWTNKSENKF